jgi:hypothetical protein
MFLPYMPRDSDFLILIDTLYIYEPGIFNVHRRL